MSKRIPDTLPTSIRSPDGKRKANIKKILGVQRYYVDLWIKDGSGTLRMALGSPEGELGKERAFQIASDWVAGV